MHEQALDLAAVRMVLHRHRRNLLIAGWIGATAGLALGVANMPQWTSSAEVLLPPPVSNNGQPVTREVDTAVTVAGSDLVLGAAGRRLDPPLRADEVNPLVTVTAVTQDVLHFATRGGTPDEAQALAHAMADAELSYLANTSSSMSETERSALVARESDLERSLKDVSAEIDRSRGQDIDLSTEVGRTQAAALAQLSAQQGSLSLKLDDVRNKLAETTSQPTGSIIQDPAPAKRPGLVRHTLALNLFGGLLGAGIAAAVALRRSRLDRRLRKRDDIADAVGSPVIASVHSVVDGTTVAGWTTLLDQYVPSKVDAWAMRRALHHLTAEQASGSRQVGSGGSTGVSHPRAVLVLSLSGDTAALAVGPQLASYMATLGVRVQLVPALRHDSADSFWAACADVASGGEPRPGLSIAPREESGSDAEMTVFVGVLDRARPELVAFPAGVAAVLAVSSASATDEEFAHAAVAADDVRLRLAGVIVVNPDPLDRTTGRTTRPERIQQAVLPTRVTGLAAGGGERSAVSGEFAT